MSPKNTQKLCQDFPQHYGTNFPLCCGDGWTDLLYRLSRALVGHARQAGLQRVVTDVKEKQGSLRFYDDGTDKEAERLIESAEVASKTIPEVTR